MNQYQKIGLLSYFVVFFNGCPSWAIPPLLLTESGTSITHTVTVESHGQFRLVFEADMDHCLLKWYDLVNDPIASNDLVQNMTDYLPSTEQGAILNSFLRDFDAKARIDIASAASPAVTKGSAAPQPPLDPASVERGKHDMRHEHTPKLRAAILSYSAYPTSVARWIDQRFAMQVGGKQPPARSLSWMGYVDIYGLGNFAEYRLMKDFAGKYRLSYEDMLLHAVKDYTPKTRPTFRNMDKFDVFEGKNGILKTRDNRHFEDLTAKAYNGSVEISDTLYIGYEEPFAEVNLEFVKPGERVSSHADYWNGTGWRKLPLHDGTNGFAADGRLSFVPPADWAVTSVNGSHAKYFLRLIVNDAERYPVSRRIYGDSWLNADGKSCRGWDDGDRHIVNSGPLTFNPSPPGYATALFPYQARICSWGPDHFVADPADVQQIDGERARPWARYVAERILALKKEFNFQGIMCDDGEKDVASDALPASATDFARKSSGSWSSESSAKYADIAAYVRKADPTLLTGINGQRRDIALNGDWTLAEFHTAVWKTGSPRNIGTSDSATVLTYDDYLPVNNPSGIFALLMYCDTVDIVPNANAPWDRANRGPLAALSKHYVGMNDNTVFSYYSRGGFIYDETDEVVLKNGKVLHQSTDPPPPIEEVKRWATYFPAMSIDLGAPDKGGRNGGERDFAWKRGKEIGGGPDIWRRDFTNAVILHRPAFYNTTKREYESYSDDIPLGAAYYPLRADGVTAAAVDRIALRAGEGAILMKYPVPPARN